MGNIVFHNYRGSDGTTCTGTTMQIGAFSSKSLDIIAQDSGELVFVEVKTRRGIQMGTPEEALTREKAEKLRQLAQLYLAENDSEQDWRIDLVAIEIDGKGKLIRCDHIRDAVLGW